MNERIKDLAKQANIHFSRVGILDGDPNGSARIVGYSKMEKFAELIVRECKENFAKVWYEQGLDIRGAELGKFLTRFEQHFGVEE